MNHRNSTAVALCGVLFVSSAFAAEEHEDYLPEVVVEAVRNSILPDHVPGNATVIGEEAIKESGARSLAELLVARGGLRISSTSGNAAGGAIQLRGFGENSASRVLIMVDGRPVNRPDMGAVSLLEVSLGTIERVEILRGAQTARFGDNAVGGVVNLVTREAKAGGEGYIETAGGSDDLALYRLGYGGQYGENGVRVDLERNFTSGWRDNAASEMESAFFRWDRKLGQEASVDFGAGWSDEFTGFPGPLGEARYRDDPRQSIYTEYGVGDQYFSEQTRWTADAALSLGKTTDWSFDAPLAWSRRDQSWNFGPGSHTDNLLDSLTLRPVVAWKGRHWRIETGASLRYDHLDLDQFAEIQRRRKTAEAELSRWVYGGFMAAEMEPWEDWHFSAAMRLEGSQVDARAASLSSPGDPSLNFGRGTHELDHAFQLGLRWEGKQASAWLRYDRLYRLPSTDEIASYQGYPLSVPFNDQLTAETGDQVELGGEISSDGWRLRVNGFAQWLEGEIAYDYLRNLNVNFADTKRLGVETEIGYESARWDAVLRHTWLSATFRDGEYAGNGVYLVPEYEISALVGWRPVDQLLLQAEYQYVGAAFEGNDFMNDRPKLPAYGVANLMVRWDWGKGLSVYGRVNNLTDERYATVKYSGVWYPAAGRQFQVGLRKEF